MAAKDPEKDTIIVTNDVPSGRAFVPLGAVASHDPGFKVGREVQYRAKAYVPVMKVKITARKRDSAGKWVYQVKDSDGRAVKGKDHTEAEWIPEQKLRT